jgi:hypothetical protein
MFSQNFSIIGVAVRELHLPKVEGIKLSMLFLKFNQNSFKFQGITFDLKNKNLKYFVTLLLVRLASQKSNA